VATGTIEQVAPGTDAGAADPATQRVGHRTVERRGVAHADGPLDDAHLGPHDDRRS
jgi:hypothetical protein